MKTPTSNLKLLIIIVNLLWFVPIAFTQNNINSIAGETNVFKVQEALGVNANYFPIKNYMDSLVQNGYLNDTLEDGDAAKFSRWDWFWNGRTVDASNLSNNGKFSNYLALMQKYALTNCTNNPTNIQYNWNLLGPKQHPEQRMGRIDLVKTVPNNPTVLYAGAPTGGLWRTNDYTIPNPLWTNITDNIGLPYIGVNQMVFNPVDNDIAYITAAYPDWSNYSMGVFKTTNLSAPQPTWTKILGGPIVNGTPSLEFRLRKILTHPTNANEIYVLRDNELLRSVDGGINFTTLLPPFPVNHTSVDFILDKNNPDIIYITSYVVNSYGPPADIDGFLWKFDISNPALINITSYLPTAPKSWMKLDNGQSGTFIIYATNSSATSYAIVKTDNSGVSWQLMSNTPTNVIGPLSIFEVSDANDAIIYLEGGVSTETIDWRRKIIKSFDSGNTFKQQNGYNGYTGGVFTHADVRGFHMINPSLDGLSDEFVVGNDGGILYSNSSNGQTGSAHQVNWQNKNGIGLAITQFFGLGQTQLGEDIYAGGAQDNGLYVKSASANNWNITIVGDGYEAFFMKKTPNISFYEGGGTGPQARYHRNTTFLTLPFNTPELSLPDNVFLTCKSYLWDQPLLEVKNTLYTSFHDVYKSTDNGIFWTNITNFTTTNGSFNLPHNFVIDGLAVGHQNQNVIYTAFRGQTWNQDLSPLSNSCAQTNPTIPCTLPNLCPLSKKFFKTTDGGTTWADYSQNFANPNPNSSAIRWYGVTDLTISTTDDNKVWAAFDGIGNETNLCIGVERVNRTTDGGLTWTDYSNGLPYLPVNNIEYYAGTNDGLFAATDVGMYYTDADLYPIHGWIKLDLNLPAVIANDIDINYCRGKIRITTFGRGMWEADLQSPFIPTSQEITTNTTWVSDRDVITDLVIKTGATLTINTGVVINVAKGKKIIVEQGGRLIVNGATITNQCGEMWHGIEVQGDMNESQLTNGAQGYLEIKNEALIENARAGAYASKHDANNNPIWGTFGGIIKVSNSTFKNNGHGIDFGPYQNFIPGNPLAIKNDFSFVLHTTFTWDDTGNMIALGVQPYSHIGLWLNHGIVFAGNVFKNDASYTTYSEMNRGIGLVTYDSEYSVVSKYNSTTSTFDDTYFGNLTYGIKAESSNSFNSFVVKNTIFFGCLRGIYLKNVDYAEVVNSTFDVASEFFGNPSYGIYLDNCNGYEVEENNFLSIAGNATYGIYTKASGTTANEIYNNQLNNLQIANQTEGVNGLNTLSASGLVFRCNQNTGITAADIAVTTGVVNKNQGNCNNDQSPANNKFSSAANNIWLNSSMPFMDYFYSSGNPQLVPTNNFPPGAVNAQPCLGNFNQSLNCPSRQQVVSNPTGLLADISNLNLQLQTTTNVIDNGSTKSLLGLINSTAPDWQIRNELMAASPYLSEEVLVAMLLKSPALPNWVLQQVLNANAPLTDKVFATMLVRTPALPDYLVHQLAMESSPLSKTEQLTFISRTPALPDWVITPVMIENSPLFDEVLIALMERTPKIADWSIRNIFVRNTPLSEEVETILLTKNYPNWLINNINNSPFVAGEAIEKLQPTSPLLEQYNEISVLEQSIQLTENELFRTYLHDTTGTYGLADVIAYLDQNNGCRACDIKLSAAFIKNKEHQKAQTKIDSLRQDTTLTDFCDFHTALNELCQLTPSVIDTFTNAGITQTVTHVANSPQAGREKAGAETLLQFAGLGNFLETFEPLNANLRTGSKEGQPAPGTIQILNSNYKDDLIKVYPNPNNGNFYLDYHIDELSNGYFILTDISGKEMWRKTLTKSNETVTVNLSQNTPPGMYLYQIVVNGEVFTIDKLIITQ